MKLAELLAGTTDLPAAALPDVEVTGLAYDSRRVRSGDLFFALPGLRHDGATFVAAAFERGARAAVAGGALELPPDARERTIVRVADPRRAMGEAACRFHGHPSRAMKVVGVTGTNGKTTTTYLLEGVFRHAGWRPGILGTTGVRIGDELRPSAFTTPEAPELQALLRDMVGAGVAAVAMEVSSHALAQRRSQGLECDVAVFTNLTHDHLDFHGTLERYLDAKLMLFDGRNAEHSAKPLRAAINLDDPRAATVLDASHRGRAETWTFGASAAARVRIEALEVEPRGLRFTFVEAGARTPVRLARLGRFNAWNAAAAFASARALGLEAGDAVAGIESAPAVPGRLERIEAGQPYEVVVDYAHSPDALERSLAAVREHTHGRVLVVFGCGGDRDRAKRPVMGSVAERGADVAWVTNDNPRSEDPAAIAREIAAGMGTAPRIVLDRRDAIAESLAAAVAGDVVLIAGKGHESTQTIGDRVLPFDDREVARELLRARAGAGR